MGIGDAVPGTWTVWGIQDGMLGIRELPVNWDAALEIRDAVPCR
jgi:hypothetical protein